MLPGISHPSFTFVQLVNLWKTPYGKEDRYYLRDEVSRKIRENNKPEPFVTNPLYQKGDAKKNRFRREQPLDLVISFEAQQEIEQRQKHPIPKIVEFLDQLFLDKVKNCNPSSILALIESQRKLFLAGKKREDCHFAEYLKTLFENNPSYSSSIITKWIEECLPSQQSTKHQTKQLSARQIVLAFEYLSQCNYFKKATRDNAKTARFYSFVSGKAEGTFTNHLELQSSGRIKNKETIKEVKGVITDLLAIQEMFEACGYNRPAKNLEDYLQEFNKKLSALEQ